MTLSEDLLAQLKRDEGLRLSAYLDTVGILTVGYGHNCLSAPVHGVSKPGDTITQKVADALLSQDAETIVREVQKAFPWVRDMTAPRQAVLYGMGFNLGLTRLHGFKRFLTCAELGAYTTAATEMLDSKWARQVKGRARRLADQMRTGEWV